MIKLSSFIALLTPIGLLPTFQGGDEEEHKEPATNFYFPCQAYKKRVNPISSRVTSDPRTGPFKKKIGGRVALFLDKGGSSLVSGRAIISAFINKITQREMNGIKGLSYWIEETGSNSTKSYTELTPSSKITKGASIRILVPKEKEKEVLEYINKINPGRKGPTEEKKNWTKREVGSAIAATVVVVFAIAGLIYYFVLPSKDASVSPPREEEQAYEEEQQEENEGRKSSGSRLTNKGENK